VPVYLFSGNSRYLQSQVEPGLLDVCVSSFLQQAQKKRCLRKNRCFYLSLPITNSFKS
jgi:hypothetical protein